MRTHAPGLFFLLVTVFIVLVVFAALKEKYPDIGGAIGGLVILIIILGWGFVLSKTFFQALF